MAATTLDVGNLLISDTRLLDLKEYKSNQNEYLKNLVQENTQLIINSVFNLPIETVDDVLCAKLPKPTTILPREKPLPKAKPLTKWQAYAKLKNIKNVKKTRMVFDEVTKEYKPRYGYKRANDDTKDWLIEVPGNAADPNEDFFAKRIEAKSERKNKNELQRLRNIARSKNGKIRGIPLIPNDQPNKLDLVKSLHVAKTSDASMSKFSEKVENEDVKTKGLGKKRKHESNFSSLNDEKAKQLKIFSNIVSNREKSAKEKLNLEPAVNKQIAKEDNENGDFKKKKKGSFKKGGFKKGRSFGGEKDGSGGAYKNKKYGKDGGGGDRDGGFKNNKRFGKDGGGDRDGGFKNNKRFGRDGGGGDGDFKGKKGGNFKNANKSGGKNGFKKFKK